MTSREIVQRTLTFDFPERVARSFDGADVVGAGYRVVTPETDWQEVRPGRWERLDEWGNTWARVDPTSKGEVAKGVLDDLADLDQLEFPDFSPAAAYNPGREMRRALLAQFSQQFLNAQIHIPQDALEDFGMEDIMSVNGNRDTPSGGVLIDVMAAARSGQSESAPFENMDDLTGRETRWPLAHTAISTLVRLTLSLGRNSSPSAKRSTMCRRIASIRFDRASSNVLPLV